MKKNRLLANVSRALVAAATGRLTIENDCIPYAFHDLPLKKVINAARVGLSFHLKSGRAWGWPTALQVEPSSLCNLKCALCPVTEGMERPVGHLRFDLFKQTVDALADYLLLVVLFDWGEPFLNPAIYDMIAYAKQKQLKVVSSSNGHVFADPARARKLIRSGIDNLFVALDGTTQQSYERFRKTGDLQTVLEGLRNLVAAKRAERARFPIINLRFVATRDNEHEIPRLKQLALELGVDVLSIKTLNPYDVYSESRADRLAYYRTAMPENERLRRFRYEGDSPERVRTQGWARCSRPWDCFHLRWNGVVSLCPFDFKETYAVGDVTKTPLSEIWFKGFAAHRRALPSPTEAPAICEHCTQAFVGGSCDGDIIAAVYCAPWMADHFRNTETPEKVHLLA